MRRPMGLVSYCRKVVFSRRHRAQLVLAHIAGAVQPIHRGDWFEDPIEAELEALGCKVTGGGTQMAGVGIIAACDIEIRVPNDANLRQLGPTIAAMLERAGAPRGSSLRLPDRTVIQLGTWANVNVGLHEEFGGRLRRDEREVPHNDKVDGLMPRLDAVLKDRGQVRSWSLFDDGALLHLFGPSMDALRTALQEAIHGGVLPPDASTFSENG